MTKQDIINALIEKGYNNNASATQQDLYSTINKSQLFSATNRLNAGWARGKYVIASFDESKHQLNEYINQWRQKVERFQDQILCIEVEPDNWKFFNYKGDAIEFTVHHPSFDKTNKVYEDAVKFKHILEYFYCHLLYLCYRQERYSWL